MHICFAAHLFASVLSSGRIFQFNSSASSEAFESATIPHPACALKVLSLITTDLSRILLSRCPSQSLFKNDPQYGPRAIGSSSFNLLQALNLGAPLIDPPGQQAYNRSIHCLLV